MGFTDVSVAAESSFPVQSLLCESNGSATIEMPQFSLEQEKEIGSVLSIKVNARKPK